MFTSIFRNKRKIFICYQNISHGLLHGMDLWTRHKTLSWGIQISSSLESHQRRDVFDPIRTFLMNLKFSQIITLYFYLSYFIKCTEQSIKCPSKWKIFDHVNKTTRGFSDKWKAHYRQNKWQIKTIIRYLWM